MYETVSPFLTCIYMAVLKTTIAPSKKSPDKISELLHYNE